MMETMEPIIVQHYKDYNDVYYSGSLGWFERWTHKSLEKFKQNNSNFIILDVGGGDGQHVPYIVGDYEKYIILDLLDHSKTPNPGISKLNLSKLDFIIGDAEVLPFEDGSVDRVILTCVLHHVDSPVKVLSECRRVLRDGGILSVYLPNDPGMVYRWIRHFGAHMKYAKKTKRKISEIKFLWAVEHKNHVLGLNTIVKMIFRNDVIRRRSYPLPLGSWNVNLFQIFQIYVNKGSNV
jgi:ubiquinone/menaquinone biosynthesis C-methylase UbiE